jgi:hypothetical protein
MKDNVSFEVRTATEKDIPEILEIVEENLGGNLTERERISEGFITYKPNSRILKTLISENKVIVGQSQKGEIGGYLILMEEDDAKRDSFFSDFYEHYQRMGFEGRPLPNQNPAIFAQDAIKNEYKGTNLFGELLKYGKKVVGEQGHEVIIGEIDSENNLSLNAHRKRGGFQEVGSYKANGRNWKVVATRIDKNRGLEQRVTSVIAVAGFLGSLIFLQSNITGNAIADLSTNTTSWVGGVLLAVGLVAGFFWIISKKKNPVVKKKK